MRPQGAVILSHTLDRRAHQLALGLAYPRVPAVENQNGTRHRAVVAGLVLESVVEHEGLPLTPLAPFGAYPEHTAGRDDQWQVYDEPRVVEAGVWRNVCASVEHGEHHIRTAARNVPARPRLQCRDGSRAAG